MRLYKNVVYLIQYHKNFFTATYRGRNGQYLEFIINGDTYLINKGEVIIERKI